MLILLAAGCGQTKGKKSVVELVEDLKHNDEAVRMDAAAALGKVNSSEVSQAVPVLSAALKDPSAYVRQSAAKSLKALGPDAQAAVPALKAALKDSDHGVRIWAGEALENIQGK
jgi:HEAT repeat protein